MQSDDIKLLEKFETEMWLYIDESLPVERMKFWEDKIDKHPKLKQMLDNSLHALSLYNGSNEFELSESIYNEMIAKAAVERNHFTGVINKFLSNIILPFLTSYRLAFGAAIIVFVVLLTFIIEKPNGNNIQQTPRLDWKGNDLTSKLDKVGNSIDEMKTENTLEYQMYRLTKDKFDVAIESIGDRIEKLRDNMKNESL